MAKYRLYLSEHDVQEAISQLGIVCQTHGCQIEGPEQNLDLTKARSERPYEFGANLRGPADELMTVRLAPLGRQKRQLSGHSFALTLVTTGDLPLAGQLMEALRVALASTIPGRFWSMEHFLGTIKSPLVTQIATLTENLILNGLQASAQVLEGFAPREKLSFERPTVGDRLSYLRVELKEDTFTYLPMNEFQVYQKGEVLAAVGLTKEGNTLGTPRTFLTAWFSAEHSETLNGLFGRNFDKALFDGVAVKGGKFTGDQKILRLKDKPAFADLKLEPSVREKIEREILGFFRLEPVYRKAGLPFKRGIALYGPPGTGKTMLAKVLASTLEQTVVWVRAGDLEGTADINRVFQLARIGAPSVLILEDIDLYLQDRDNLKSNSVTIANMLAQLDGLEENDGILVLVTTNKIETVERAIVDRPGRIDSKIFMGELGRGVVIEILTAKLKDFPLDFANWNNVLPEHVLMTGAQAVELSTTILRNSLFATPAAAECRITAEAVKRALKDLERARNAQGVKGFGPD
ncbi:MAG: ATP-binding protein [Spirochaetales bacterium]